MYIVEWGNMHISRLIELHGLHLRTGSSRPIENAVSVDTMSHL